MSVINIKPTELKHIIKEVNCITGIDFSEYAYSFIKRRTEQFMLINKITSDVELIYKINNSVKIPGLFLDNVYVSQSEFFRDAEIWNFLKEKIFAKLSKKNKVIIHFPYCTGGEELYSLLYILNDFNTENFKIIVTSVTEKHESNIKKGEFNTKNIKASVKNIELLNSAIDSNDIFSESNQLFKVKFNFKGEIIYETCDFIKGKYISEFDFVFFRNSMIYFNSNLKEKALKTVVRSMKKGAYLFIGAKERLETESGKKVKLINKELNIFKKKTFS